MLRGIFRQSKVRGGGVSSPLACTQQELIWALVSLCALHRISFSAQLLTQEFPAEITPRGDAQKPAAYDESVLIRAAQASGLRIRAISLKACKAPGLPLPLLVQLNAPQSIPPTSADATAANDESIESKPSSALLSSLVLVTTATAEQVVYFQLGNQRPITVAPSAFDALHTGCAWIVTPEPEAVRDEDGQAGDGIQVLGYLNTVAAEHHGDDFLDGGKGNDKVSGQGGADQLIGGDGDDDLGGDGIYCINNSKLFNVYPGKLRKTTCKTTCKTALKHIYRAKWATPRDKYSIVCYELVSRHKEIPPRN
jgi:hypothetical protein